MFGPRDEPLRWLETTGKQLRQPEIELSALRGLANLIARATLTGGVSMADINIGQERPRPRPSLQP